MLTRRAAGRTPLQDPVTGVTEKRRTIRSVAAGVWTEYVLRDEGNSEVCEQTFAKFDNFAPAVKSMRGAMGRLYIMRMVDVHNLKITADLGRKGRNPHPAEFTRAVPRPRYWQVAAFGDSNV